MPARNYNQEQFDQSDCSLCPGETVKESGIYEICHADEPRVNGLLLRNTVFPYCKWCGEQVRYKLLQPAPHIAEDPDFVEDFPVPDNPALSAEVPTNSFPLQLGMANGFRFWQIVPAWGDGSEGGNL